MSKLFNDKYQSILQYLELNHDLVSQTYDLYINSLTGKHEEKITTFLEIYSHLDYLKDEDDRLFVQSLIFLLNSIFDSIDDSIDESPLHLRKKMYTNQIVIFSSFLYLFNIVSQKQLKNLYFLKKRIKSYQIIEKMIENLNVVEIPKREAYLSESLSKTNDIDKLISISIDFFNIRTIQTKICSDIVNIYLNMKLSHKNEVSELIHLIFSFKLFIKDLTLKEIEKDRKFNSPNFFNIIQSNNLSIDEYENLLIEIEKNLISKIRMKIKMIGIDENNTKFDHLIFNLRKKFRNQLSWSLDELLKLRTKLNNIDSSSLRIIEK